MKRKFLMALLTVALTLALVPAISAFADTDGDGILGIFTEEQELDEDADVEEEEAGDIELPKINLKSPVSQFGLGDVGETFVLVARIGSEAVDPLLVSWVSSDPSVATVAPDGTVTIVGPGRAEITAVMEGCLSGKAKVFVLENWPDKAKAKDKHENHGKGHAGGDDDSDDDSDEDAPDDEPSGDE